MCDVIIIDKLDKLGLLVDFGTNVIKFEKNCIPMKDPASLRSQDQLFEAFAQTQEPENLRSAHDRTTRILDAHYEKADLPALVKEHCSHLSLDEQCELLELLMKFEDLFDGTLGDFDTDPI